MVFSISLEITEVYWTWHIKIEHERLQDSNSNKNTRRQRWRYKYKNMNANAYRCTYTSVICRKWRNGEGFLFRWELFMLMLLNYLCYLCYCDVWLSLKEVYFGLSWHPVKAQEAWLYLCVCVCTCWQELPTPLTLLRCSADTEGGRQVITLVTSPWQLYCR